jgi:hypothetical protein
MGRFFEENMLMGYRVAFADAAGQSTRRLKLAP